MNEDNKDLYYLDELTDYKVASDYPDVRNWGVTDSSNQRVGRVDGLLVSKRAKRVVYLDVELDDAVIEDSSRNKNYEVPASEGAHEFINASGERHLIIPIGLVSIDENNKTVLGEGLDYSSLKDARRFPRRSVIVPDDELALYRHYTGDLSIDDSTVRSEKFYDRAEFTLGRGNRR